MCKELKRTFRPEHRDIEVLFEDDFGVQKMLYVGLASPNVNIEAKIAAHFAEEEQLAENVRQALSPPAPTIAPPPAPKAKKAKK